MNPLNISIAGQNADSIPGWLISIIIVGEIVWLWSVVRVATKRTEDPFDRIVWLLIVLALNIVGTILYVLFGMVSQTADSDEDWPLNYDEEIKKRANEGRLR